MGWWSTWPLAGLVVVLLAFGIASCGNPGPTTLEERAQSINKSLICPLCPGETIDQANVELALQMRAVVREKLAEGWSKERILQYFVDRYDESVLAAPPKSGFNLIAWVAPPVALAGAAILLCFVILAMRRNGRRRPEKPPLAEQELNSYLPLVDQEMGTPQEGPGEPEK